MTRGVDRAIHFDTILWWGKLRYLAELSCRWRRLECGRALAALGLLAVEIYFSVWSELMKRRLNSICLLIILGMVLSLILTPIAGVLRFK